MILVPINQLLGLLLGLLSIRATTAADWNNRLPCTQSTEALKCTNGDEEQVELTGELAGVPHLCHDHCERKMGELGWERGCWLIAGNGNCYCRSGEVSEGGTRAGGSCGTPSTGPSPTPPPTHPDYLLTEKGESCGDAHLIRTLDECREAVDALGINVKSEWLRTWISEEDYGMPGGCSVNMDKGGLKWNANIDGQPNESSKIQSVCLKVAAPTAPPSPTPAPTPDCYLEVDFGDVDTTCQYCESFAPDGHKFQWWVFGNGSSEWNLGSGTFLATAGTHTTLLPKVNAPSDVGYLKIKRIKGYKNKAEFSFNVKCDERSAYSTLRYSPTSLKGNVSQMNTLVWFHNPDYAAAIEFTGTVSECKGCQANNYKVQVQLLHENGTKCKVSNQQIITVPNSDEPTQHSLYATCNRSDVGSASRFSPRNIFEVRFIDESVKDVKSTADNGLVWNFAMFNGDNGIKVTLPNDSRDLMDMWHNVNDKYVSWRGLENEYENMPDFYKAHHEASILAMSVMLDSMPIPFCWKEGGDVGSSPNCKSGWEKHEKMCYKSCTKSSSRGWDLVAGVCWERCKSGYRNDGATCAKRGGFIESFDFYFRRSYITSQANFFEDEAICKDNQYKSAALCYDDCQKLDGFSGLINCGIGACAYSTNACFTEVAEMTIEAIEGIFSFTTFVSGLGNLKNISKFAQLATGPMMKASSYYINKAADVFSQLKEKLLKEEFMQEFRENVKNKVEDLLDPIYLDILGDQGLEDVVFETVNAFQSQFERNARMEKEWDVTGLAEMTGFGDMFVDCKKAGHSGDVNDEIQCARSAVEMLYLVDYTGLASMASAFLRPICKF